MLNENYIIQEAKKIKEKILKTKLTPEEKKYVESTIEMLSGRILSNSGEEPFSDEMWKELYTVVAITINGLEDMIQPDGNRTKVKRSWKEEMLEKLKELRDDTIETCMKVSSSTELKERWELFKETTNEQIKNQILERQPEAKKAGPWRYENWSEVESEVGNSVESIMRQIEEEGGTTEKRGVTGYGTQVFSLEGYSIEKEPARLYSGLENFGRETRGGGEQQFDERALFTDLESLTAENTTFEEFQEIYQKVQELKRLIETKGTNGREETLKTILESFERKLKETWIKQYTERAEEIVNFTSTKSAKKEKGIEDVLVDIERRIKVVSWGDMTKETAQEIVNQVVEDTMSLLSDSSELQDTELTHLAAIYNEEKGLKTTKKMECLQLAMGFMSRIVEEEQEKRRKKREITTDREKEEQHGTEMTQLNADLDEVLDKLEQAIEDANQGKPIDVEQVTTKTRKLLKSEKLTPEQIGNLVQCYTRAKKQLEKLKKGEKEKTGADVIIKKAEELEQKQKAAKNVGIDSRKVADVAEKSRKSLEQKLLRKIKAREEIAQILKKYKSKINKFISAFETVLEISGKYGNTIDTYKKLSESIIAVEKELEEENQKKRKLKKPEYEETMAEKYIRLEKKRKCRKKIAELLKRRGKIRTDITDYNKAFQKMKDIRSEMAEKVESSEEWSKDTKDYIKEKCKTNQAFYEVAKERRAEKDFEVSQEELEQLKTKSAQIKLLRYGEEENVSLQREGGKPGRENGRSEASRSKTGISEQKPIGQGTNGKRIGRRNATPNQKTSLLDKLRMKIQRKQKEAVDFEMDPDKNIEFINLSNSDKRRKAFEFYRDTAKTKWFGATLMAHIKSWTNKGRMEWKKQFLRKEEQPIERGAAEEYRKSMQQKCAKHALVKTMGKDVPKPVLTHDELYQDFK